MRKYLFLLLIMLTAQGLTAIDKAVVAVLDPVILDGEITSNAAPVAAVYLNDAFSSSALYRTVDRRELYTRWSHTSPGDINIVSLMERGEYARMAEMLDVDFLCISYLEKQGRGYRLSVELYDREKGAVTARESAEADRLEGLVDASRLAGARISGSSPSALPAAAAPLVAARPKTEERQAEQDESPESATGEPSSEPASEPAAAESESYRRGGKKPFDTVTFSLLLPFFTGNESYYVSFDGSTYVNTPVYEIDSYLTGGSAFDIGVDVNMRFTGTSFFCLDLGFAIASQVLTYQSTTYYSSTEETDMNFGFFDFYLGPGVVYPLTENIQLAGVLTLGYGVFMFGGQVWENEESATGVTWGFTAGADFRTGSDFVLTLRYKYSYAMEMEGLGTDFGYGGIVIGLGTAN